MIEQKGVIVMDKFDKQTTGMAGEFLAVGKLFKKGLQVSITFGNAKGIDLFVHNPENGKNYTVQVKTQRNQDNFFLKEKRIKNDIIFIFIILNEFEQNEDFFIVKGSEILKDLKKFYGQTYNNENPSEMSAIRWKSLKEEYKDKWDVFFEK